MNLKECLLFLDKILILESVFQRLHDYRLKLNPKKCEKFKSQARYLSPVVSEKVIISDTDKTSASNIGQ